MPRKIVIHAGFHKTGTSSVQQTLRLNRPVLKPYLRSILKGGMKDLLHAARGYSTWRDPLSLAKFRHRFETVLEGAASMPRRALCLAAEELSGHMPGRGDLVDYAAAPHLAAEMASAAAQISPQAEVVFYYSTRAPESWLRSNYWEHVKSSSMTLDFEAFAETYSASADLDGIVDQIATAQPNVVHRCALEDTNTLPAGPATPLLTLCNVPEETLDKLEVPLANSAADRDVLLALLDANRRYTDRDARKSAKLAILATARENTDD